MDQPANFPQTSPWQASEAEAPPQEALPHHIGRYRVEKVLGEGGFGRVFLAHDDKLNRPVAIKVPHRKLVRRPEDAEIYLMEAQNVANLDHPNIVPVHDVGSTEEYPCFIVSKYVEGSTLAQKIRESRPLFSEAAVMVVTLAEALHYAHRKGLVHRDIKPGNILLDSSGKPYIADFGLALKEENIGKGPKYAGTPAYMSPEQARGEGHRVDGRSDIFSLGVILYELVTGRQPFRADSHAELMEQITFFEPRPPRQHDDAIPKELERICLKALAKRASERYTTAKDVADDLRHFVADKSFQEQPARARSESPASPVTVAEHSPALGASPSGTSSTTATTPTSDNQPVKIVPRGLRSFDAHDADFFLELVPGPRDRAGLPDSIRFWKNRIEETDPEKTFAVGLIYGPSGCGKSSLVKAGLLPRLSANVTAVYIEASASDTETWLQSALWKQCPSLAVHPSLKETLAALRRGEGMPVGKKVLIVLDQFEQWLHANQPAQDMELVQALRQCDGGRVQCLIMVRDDFWLAVCRFMQALEIPLSDGYNSALADLFDMDHARKVLAALGRAFGRLPEDLGESSKEQKDFLKQAVSGLALEGKLVCVRLALFAEMMKGRPWTPATLKEMGGIEGVGLNFLEGTFSAATAPPQHRYHQNAARAVLKALLPESGADIKGHMRSYTELLEASGYASRPGDFADLIRILDGEIRLITPIDPEGMSSDESGEASEGTADPLLASPRARAPRFYQLTHDYLVHSLRDWLTRKQKETRRGRAELLLADRAAVWNARPETRQLLSLPQWVSIRLWTAKNSWTAPEKRMMRKAARYHAVRAFVLVACLMVLSVLGREGLGRLKAHTLHQRLLEATTADVPGIVREMAPYRRWVDPLLEEAYVQTQTQKDPRKLLHVSLALLPVDPAQAKNLYGRLLRADAAEVSVIREALFAHRQDLLEPLWSLLLDQANDQEQRLRAACALATFAPDDPRWEKAAAGVAGILVLQKPFEIAKWTDALRPVGTFLIHPLADFLEDEKRSGSERGLIANVYGEYARHVPGAFVRLEKCLAEESAANVSAAAKLALAKKQAHMGVILLVMGRGEKVWPLLKHQPDPTRRSFLIESLGPGGVDPGALINRLSEETDPSIRRAILLSMGEFGLDRQHLLPRLLQLYRDDLDPGTHSAAEWLLRKWQTDKLSEIDASLATGKAEGKRHWYVNRQGQMMSIVARPGEFWMGDGIRRHKRRINRSYAIASKEVTVEQFLRLHKDHKIEETLAPTRDCPVLSVTWYEAAEYCNWLSNEEGLGPEQWCYLPNQAGKYADGMKMAADYLQRTGYRLPTEAEWEYACRAGAATDFSWGQTEELLGKYAWHLFNSFQRSHPVGALKPNDLGLYDMHGNAWEWTQDAYRVYVKAKSGKATDDVEDMSEITTIDSRVLRGGSFFFQAADARSANRLSYVPTNRFNNVGFRVARTFRAE